MQILTCLQKDCTQLNINKYINNELTYTYTRKKPTFLTDTLGMKDYELKQRLLVYLVSK